MRKYLESCIPVIRRLADEGQPLEVIAAEIGVSRKTLSQFMKDNGIKRNKDTINNTVLNDTAENRAIIKKKIKHHVRLYCIKYNIPLCRNDREYKGRSRSNRQKISYDTIESEAGFIAAKCLKSYDPTNKIGASFGTYLERALVLGMVQVSRIGYDNARFINLSTSTNMGDDEGPMDNLTGQDVGIENMLAVDIGGEDLGLMGGKGFNSMLMETSWNSAPHVQDKRIFHCFECHTDYLPHAITKPVELPTPSGWKARRYACPYCGSRIVFYTGMSVPGLSSGHEKQRKAHKKWNRFFPRPYKVLENPPNNTPTISLIEEDNHVETFRAVRSKKESVAQRILRENFLRNNFKLLWYQPQSCVAPTQRVRSDPVTYC